jgi:hypothetical protein
MNSSNWIGSGRRAFVEGFDHTAPRLALAIFDFAQIQDPPLHHAPARTALALYNAQ